MLVCCCCAALVSQRQRNSNSIRKIINEKNRTYCLIFQNCVAPVSFKVEVKIRKDYLCISNHHHRHRRENVSSLLNTLGLHTQSSRLILWDEQKRYEIYISEKKIHERKNTCCYIRSLENWLLIWFSRMRKLRYTNINNERLSTFSDAMKLAIQIDCNSISNLL